MLDALFSNRLPVDRLDELADQIDANEAGYDPWGVHLGTIDRWMVIARWAYKHYFRVRTFGLDNVPEGPVMVVPNHSGQLPLDGMLIAVAFLFEAERPRLLRGMIERWFPTVPFLGSLLQRCGQVVGDPENCRRLLDHGQSIMVFPEGARGGGKPWFKRYQLQRFGTGFMRIALEAGVPIIPTAVIGAEDTYPSVANVKPLAELLGTPYFPLWPQMLLGPLAAVPFPVRIDLHFGEPLDFEGGGEVPDAQIRGNVESVKQTIAHLIERGLENRAGESDFLEPLARLTD
jgi:1-acyl-sn-glycerol-3-phosphate acyltransferase